jgi:uncharacterized integral membrane protein
MSGFTIFALILFAAVAIFSLSNPDLVTVRFLAWHLQTSLALAVVGAGIVGGLLVLLSSVVGQQQMRARLRDLQTRLRELEGRLATGDRSTDRPPDQH